MRFYIVHEYPLWTTSSQAKGSLPCKLGEHAPFTTKKLDSRGQGPESHDKKKKKKSQHSSSFSSKLGMPFLTGNLRPDSGHTRKPSTSTTCSAASAQFTACCSTTAQHKVFLPHLHKRVVKQSQEVIILKHFF